MSHIVSLLVPNPYNKRSWIH